MAVTAAAQSCSVVIHFEELKGVVVEVEASKNPVAWLEALEAVVGEAYLVENSAGLSQTVESYKTAGVVLGVWNLVDSFVLFLVAPIARRTTDSLLLLAAVTAAAVDLVKAEAAAVAAAAFASAVVVVVVVVVPVAAVNLEEADFEIPAGLL